MIVIVQEEEGLLEVDQVGRVLEIRKPFGVIRVKVSQLIFDIVVSGAVAETADHVKPDLFILRRNLSSF